MKYQTVYFKKPGPDNTYETLELVKEWAAMLDINTILVATTTGQTAVSALEKLKKHRVIVVTHSMGFREENTHELTTKNREKIVKLNGHILTCQHAFAGISRAVRLQFKTYELDEIVANTLRIMGQGLKVATEISLMAADSGLIRTDQDIISVGGTDRGADTAAVIKPANVSRFFDLELERRNKTGYTAFVEHSKTTHPLGRIGESEEIAELIYFLATPVSGWITGETIAIDGGRAQTCAR
jgi:hypothetical protein